MKLVTLVIAFLSIAPAFAQSNLKRVPPGDLSKPDSTSQAGCPVAFTDVSLETQAHFMPIRQDAAPDGNLRFQYKNQSGKEIQSISVRAELKVKKSVYDLDATTITLNMTLTGKSAEETMPLALRAYGLSRITLEQVSFTDGTIWNAATKNTCNYEHTNGSEQIGKLQ